MRLRDKITVSSWVDKFWPDSNTEWDALIRCSMDTTELITRLVSDLEYLITVELVDEVFEVGAIHQGGALTGPARTPAIAVRGPNLNRALKHVWSQAQLLHLRRATYATMGKRVVQEVR